MIVTLKMYIKYKRVKQVACPDDLESRLQAQASL